MILIADSGSTKTDWCILESENAIKHIKTKGTNPFFQTENEISNEIKKSLLPQLPTLNFESIHFYGAGCGFPDKISIVKKALAQHLTVAQDIEVCTDMLGAARALCQNESGIACIMGTGSNSCFYNGKEITENVSPLGFILGDEGSGANIGKIFIGDILKNQLPSNLKNEFLKYFNTTPGEIIDKVYRQPFPNRYLASLSPFIAMHLNKPEIKQLVKSSFKSFIKRNIMQYDYKKHNVNFTGSISYYYKPLLEESCIEMGINIGKIEKDPMPGLIEYHKKINRTQL